MQISAALPARAHMCAPGHHPQLIESRGRPPGAPIASGLPAQHHVECACCGIATVPAFSADEALRRWAGKHDLWHVPLARISEARLRALAHAA